MPSNFRRSSALLTFMSVFSLVLPAARAAAEEPGEPVPQLAEVLDVFRLIAGKPITELTPQDARQQFAAEDAEKILARINGDAEAPRPLGRIVDGRQIPGPASALPIRIYYPRGDGPFPVIVYFHGGGFVIATIDTYDATARALAAKTSAIVVSVEYRKAPEARFPAAVDDAVASYRWVLSHAASIGGDSNKIAVAGESAGGNLATEICLAARDSGFAMPKYQLLVYPVTDFAKTDYPSDQEYANAVPLNLPELKYFAENYLPSSADASNAQASPLYASLKGLPPTTIIAAQIDPLQDQGRAYATKLEAAGVKVHYALFNGVTHEFFGMSQVVDVAKDAQNVAAADLRRAFQ